MKKLILFITAATITLGSKAAVFAQNDNITFKDKAGITPDNQIIYPIDKYMDNLRIKLSSNSSKADVLINVAEERLGESEKMSDDYKEDLSIKAINEYTTDMDKALEIIKSSIEDSTSDESNSYKFKKLQDTINESEKNSIEVLNKIQNKLSNSSNAKETITKVIEMQQKKKEALSEIAKQRVALIDSKKAVNDAKKQLETLKNSGNEEAVKNAENLLKEKEQALSVQKEQFKQALKDKKGELKGLVGEVKKQVKNENKKDKSEESNEVVNPISKDESNTTDSQNTSVSPASTSMETKTIDTSSKDDISNVKVNAVSETDKIVQNKQSFTSENNKNIEDKQNKSHKKDKGTPKEDK
ncbi:hypothetical protein HBE96_08185 [Clostridium sp. P21]|uniref:DUF5667 domain-containing protein n=1 Tax=Clostridium muellerianum TaxID=2716538 RepID=A0A7Y0HNH2_9CLOT|nr:DUF5667 domain-containing protein [Clostridium muellerianum]NMM62672.1 hypothetical protein [Clostridium muellerianum]